MDLIRFVARVLAHRVVAVVVAVAVAVVTAVQVILLPHSMEIGQTTAPCKLQSIRIHSDSISHRIVTQM